jgi:hypothetical protein
MQLHRYLGRIVRLEDKVYQASRRRAMRDGYDLENCFLVSESSRSVDRLICYAASVRIVVNAADVVLV